MNFKKLQFFTLTCSVFILSALNAQNSAEKLAGYYLGFNNNEYSFSYIEMATGKKEVINFQYVKPALIETYNLQEEFFEGVYFEVTYFSSEINGKYTYRITDLKEIKEKSKEDLTKITSSETKEVPEKLTAIFTGFKDNYYSFSYVEEATSKKETIHFQEASDRVIRDYNLQEEFFEGVRFEVTYVTDNVNGKTIYIIVELREIEE